jgi:NifU-like protein
VTTTLICLNHFQLNNFLDPKNVGDAAEPSFAGQAASFECGAVLRISLHIDEQQKITDAKFRAAGCSVLVAAASYLTQAIRGETTGDAAALAQHSDLIKQHRNPSAIDRTECVALACEALIAAIKQYSDSIRDEWTGDDALICTCFSVSERTIEREIETKKLTTIQEVTRACNAGAGCRSCYPLIEDILRTREKGEEGNGEWVMGDG